MWLNRMSVEEKKWLEFFLLDKLEEYRKNRVSPMDDEVYKLPETEVEVYKRFCKYEISTCESLIYKYNIDFDEFLQKRVPPPF